MGQIQQGGGRCSSQKKHRGNDEDSCRPVTRHLSDAELIDIDLRRLALWNSAESGIEQIDQGRRQHGDYRNEARREYYELTTSVCEDLKRLVNLYRQLRP